MFGVKRFKLMSKTQKCKFGGWTRSNTFKPFLILISSLRFELSLETPHPTSRYPFSIIRCHSYQTLECYLYSGVARNFVCAYGVYVCVYMCMWVCVCVCVCMCVYMCVFMCVWLWVLVCVCVCKSTFLSKKALFIFFQLLC